MQKNAKLLTGGSNMRNMQICKICIFGCPTYYNFEENLIDFVDLNVFQRKNIF